ncbi:MAG TPA: hypothetical protein VFX64_07130 [Candidatus Nitrosotalea sp.]|nr:hypothetical protein [Candidatus Nitrosotalea sp.]
MSHSVEPSDSSKSVVKDKNPHNYRKVGYSMIVISVSLVLIGLLVWAIGDNYHFSGDIMAKQEIDSMTPKSGYTVVVFDYTQPIGAKLKLLGAAASLDDAEKLRDQNLPEYSSQKGQVLIFDKSIANNTNSVSYAEVYAMTPTSGYDVVSFNTVMPVGARLASQTLDSSSGAAVNDSARYSSANVDKLVQIITLTSSFDDNLKQVLGSNYDLSLVDANINNIRSMPAKMIPPPPAPVVPVNVTIVTPVPQNITSVVTNVTKTTTQNTTATVTSMLVTNSTNSSSTIPDMKTGTKENLSIAENVTTTSSSNQTTTNQTASNSSKSISLSEQLVVNSTSK